MSIYRIRVDIAESEGAPSPTAVFENGPHFSLPLRHSPLLKQAYVELQNLGHTFSKIALVSRLGADIGYKAVQVKGTTDDGTPILECGRDCGNSMVAAAIVAMRRGLTATMGEGERLRMINQDTDMIAEMEVLSGATENTLALQMHVMNVIGRNIREILINPGSVPIWSVETEIGTVPVTTLNLVNPYIIANAESFGIYSAQDLLRLPTSDLHMVEKLMEVRRAVVRNLRLNQDSEFPKIAVIQESKDKIAARTLYLNGLHKGLPITGAISIAVASRLRDAQQYNGGTDLLIQSPKEEIPLFLDITDELIRTCVVSNRRAIIKNPDIYISLSE